MTDQFNLERFVVAQRENYAQALLEVRQGMKRTHWIWYIFPQIAGLGHSTMARLYAITGLDEAKAYLAHPLLGVRLREITAALGDLEEPNPGRLFGSVDAMKLRSSLTLFALADDRDDGLFRRTLGRWFSGEEDNATIERLR